MDDKLKEEIQARTQEIEKLYGITEPETHLMNQMLMMVTMLGYSPKLTVKLLKVLTAVMEMSIEVIGERYEKK